MYKDLLKVYSAVFYAILVIFLKDMGDYFFKQSGTGRKTFHAKSMSFWKE